MEANNTKVQNFVKNEAKEDSRYGVILAGGDGTRLKSLTRAITGEERPKQFCPILDGQTLLAKTRQRVARLIDERNTLFVLTRKHAGYYNIELAGMPQKNLIVQSENRGTAPAILYSLLRLAKRDPDAIVAFFPSDHYFSDDAAFMAQVECGFRFAEREKEKIVLLGIEPDKAETSYGWIEPVENLFGQVNSSVSQVERFWEKPDHKTALQLIRRGCLWNSFVMVGSLSAFLAGFERYLPNLIKLFHAVADNALPGNEFAKMRSLYSWINDVNFSSEFLEKCKEELFVLRVGDVGWSDWGEPVRVLGTLNQLGIQTAWMATAGSY